MLVEVLPHVRDIRRQGAAALDLCSVACGRLDGYYERGLAAWDLAAGGLIATEAGAVVTDLGGGQAVPGSVVAAAPGIAPAAVGPARHHRRSLRLTAPEMAAIAPPRRRGSDVTGSQPERHRNADRARHAACP